MSRIIAALCAALFLIVTAGCGGNGGSSSPAPTAVPEAICPVSVDEFFGFTAEELTAAMGNWTVAQHQGCLRMLYALGDGLEGRLANTPVNLTVIVIQIFEDSDWQVGWSEEMRARYRETFGGCVNVHPCGPRPGGNQPAGFCSGKQNGLWCNGGILTRCLGGAVVGEQDCGSPGCDPAPAGRPAFCRTAAPAARQPDHQCYGTFDGWQCTPDGDKKIRCAGGFIQERVSCSNCRDHVEGDLKVWVAECGPVSQPPAPATAVPPAATQAPNPTATPIPPFYTQTPPPSGAGGGTGSCTMVGDGIVSDYKDERRVVADTGGYRQPCLPVGMFGHNVFFRADHGFGAMTADLSSGELWYDTDLDQVADILVASYCSACLVNIQQGGRYLLKNQGQPVVPMRLTPRR